MTFRLPGSIGMENFISGEEVPNYRAGLIRLVPDLKAVFTALTGLLPDESSYNGRFDMFEKDVPKQEMNVNGAHTAAVTTINVTAGDAQAVTKAFTVRCERTGEVMYVTADPASPYSAISVTRGDNLGSTAAALVDGDKLMVLSTAYEDGSTSGTAINTAPDDVYNFTQTFRTALEIDGSTATTKLVYAPNGLEKIERVEKLDDHMVAMEKAFLFGKRYKRVGPNGKQQRFTGGFEYFVTSNVTDFTGTVTNAGWDSAMETLFAYGSSKKMGLAGPRAALTIQQMAEGRGHIELSAKETLFGLTIRTWETIFGELSLIVHPLFRHLTGVKSSIMVVDTKFVKFRYKRERNTHLRKNIQPNDMDGIKHEYLTEAGIELQSEKTHGILKNMDAWSAT